MKIKELLYKTPEMTEEKLLEIMENNLKWIPKDVKNRIQSLHKIETLQKAVLDEYDLIQDKQSYLTKSQRNLVIGFVGTCMILMTKGKDGAIGEGNN